MMKMLKKFWADDDGGEVVEYALVIGLLIIGLIAIIPAINTRVQELFRGILTALTG